jgi:hypothetical protein
VSCGLYQQAVGGNVTAQIWWTKARMGWKETVQISERKQISAEPTSAEEWKKQFVREG